MPRLTFEIMKSSGKDFPHAQQYLEPTLSCPVRGVAFASGSHINSSNIMML